MVDLAKIRKKAKKAAAPAAQEQPVAVAPSVPEQVAQPESVPAEKARPAAESPSVPQPAGDDRPPQSSKLDRFKEQAGKRRETQAAAQEELTEAGQLELLTFTIAGEHYAVDIERIVEIVTPRTVTRIPNADASVVGIISLRGTIVTLVDVRRKLRHPPAGEPGPDTRIVVMDFERETMGFVVDRVLRVAKVAPGEVEPHPVVHATELEESIRGVFRTGGALTILLDLDKLLDHSRWT